MKYSNLHRWIFTYKSCFKLAWVPTYAALLALVFCTGYVQNVKKLFDHATFELVEDYEGEGNEGKKEGKEIFDEIKFLRSEWHSNFSAQILLAFNKNLLGFWSCHIPETLTPPPEA